MNPLIFKDANGVLINLDQVVSIAVSPSQTRSGVYAAIATTTAKTAKPFHILFEGEITEVEETLEEFRVHWSKSDVGGLLKIEREREAKRGERNAIS